MAVRNNLQLKTPADEYKSGVDLRMQKRSDSNSKAKVLQFPNPSWYATASAGKADDMDGQGANMDALGQGDTQARERIESGGRLNSLTATGGNVDTALLARNDKQTEDSQGVAAASKQSEPLEIGAGEENGKAAKLKENKEVDKKQEKQTTKKPIPRSPVGEFTKALLRRSWQSSFTVVGFIFGWVYINIHVFMHQIAPTEFCALGEEWTSGVVGSVAGETKNPVSATAKIIEPAGLFLIDLIALVIILMLVFWIIFLTRLSEMSWWDLTKIVWNNFWGS